MAHNPDIDRYFRPPTDAELAMRFAQETLKGYRESAAGKATIKTSARVEREINTIAEMIEEKGDRESQLRAALTYWVGVAGQLEDRKRR